MNLFNECIITLDREAHWILHRKLKYSICCVRDVILKIERNLSNCKYNTLISDVKFSWTTLQ